jgi:hypothetical protein
MSLTAIKRACRPYKNLILEIAGDSECFEVILKDGYVSTTYGETMWVFGRDNLAPGQMSASDMIDELELWLGDVEQQ